MTHDHPIGGSDFSFLLSEFQLFPQWPATSPKKQTNTIIKMKSILTFLGLFLAGTAELQAQQYVQPYPQPYPRPAAPPLAQEPASPQFEISPFYGYRFGGEVQNRYTGRTYSFEDSEAYGLFLDYAPRPNWPAKLELLWSHQDSSLNLQGLSGLGKVDMSIDQIQIGGSLERGNKHLREYVSLLAGATYYSTDSYGSDTRFSLSFGGGVKYFLTRNLALRADLRGFCTIVNGSGGFISTGGSTVVVFSGNTVWQGEATVGVSLAF
jgi:opacity protein-like surface antigen